MEKKFGLLHVRPNDIHSTSNDIHTDWARAKGLGLGLGGIRESGETGDSREEEDTQWRQVITLYTRILRIFADSVYFVTPIYIHEVAAEVPLGFQKLFQR